MPEYNITFRGWKALAAIAALLAFFAIRFWWRLQTVDENGRAALTEYLLKEYQGRGQRDVLQRLEEYKAGQPVQPLPELKPMNIEFPSISAIGTGRYTYRRMIVKVTITVDDGPPPDGRSTRYFYLNRYSVGDSWTVTSEASAYSYYSALLP